MSSFFSDDMLDAAIGLGFIQDNSKGAIKNPSQKHLYQSNGSSTVYQTNLNSNSQKTTKEKLPYTLSNLEKSRTNKTQKSVNFDAVFEKNKERQILSQRKLEEKRIEMLEKEMAEMQPCVKMSQNSKNILKSKELRESKEEKEFNNLPIYLRTNRISEKNTMSLKNLIQKENEIMDNLSTQTKKFNQKDFENFLKENESLTERKNQRTLMGTQQIEYSETTDAATFKPQINENSIKIVNNMQNLNYTDNERIARSKSFIKKEIRKAKEDIPFKPNIGKKYHDKPLDKNYYQNKEIKEKMQKEQAALNNNNYNNQYNNLNKNGNINFIPEETNDHCLPKGNTNVINKKKKHRSSSQENLYSINSRSNMPAQIAKNVIEFNPHNKESYVPDVINDFL